MASEAGAISSNKPKANFGQWIKKHCPWLLDWKSPFYFAVFLFLLAVAWSANLLMGNSGTTLLGWDYTWQFVDFAFDFWDQWHTFFATGQFPLYDSTIWLGLDNVGSNSYYSLFDPFVVWMIIFPRKCIPYLFAWATFFKLMVSGLLMRSYLKYHGVSEGASRLGAMAYAFSGYMMFMVGFQTTVSACVYVPLILHGIDQVIRERKPSRLIWGLFLMGITSFFFLVVLCIWGVIYALWNFFWTLKKRTGKENVQAIFLGIASFAIGIMLSAWTLLPSLRQSSLSGRSSSIGTAYLHAVIASLKSHDLVSCFSLIFEPGGDGPTRELMGLISFFFPSGGFLYLPLIHTHYDAWTASVFCYTPFIILFFTGIVISIKEKKWNHLIAILLCLYLVFTNFSYFFFYAFSGNGYGRWYMVLVPLIILYGCWAYDRCKENPRWVRFLGSVMSLVGTLLAYWTLTKVIDKSVWPNFHNLTYWTSDYQQPKDVSGSANALWYVYAQVAYCAAEGILFIFFYGKNWFSHAWIGMLAVEIIVAGNAASSNYYSIFKYESSFMGGTSNYENALVLADQIKKQDDPFGRTYMDMDVGSTSEYKSYNTVLGLNGCGTFHSLMNFDTEEFALMNNMKGPYSGSAPFKSYNDETIYNPSWSGYYGNKRFATDASLGYRYYSIRNDYTYWTDEMLPNVPFGAEKVYSAQNDKGADRYSIYRVPDTSLPELGHAIDSTSLYRIGKIDGSYYKNAFYSSYVGISGFQELERAENAYLNGAILEDDAEFPQELLNSGEFAFKDVPSVTSDAELEAAIGKKRHYAGSYYGVAGDLFVYTVDTGTGSGLFPAKKSSESNAWLDEMNYYLDRSKYDWVLPQMNSTTMNGDTGKMIFCSKSKDSAGDPAYLSDDPNGCYIEMKYYNNSAPRVVVFGDTFDENGNVLKKNAPLCFEYSSLSQAEGSGYFGSRSSTFGLYVKGGKARYIVFCWPGWVRSIPLNYTNASFLIYDYSEIKAMQDELASDGLKNVKKEDVNSYSFQTSYDSKRLVVTQLGYDAGWQAKATDENGNVTNCQMFKLDGGLLGFLAPEGNVTYTLSYVTPYLRGGVALAMIGFTVYAGFTVTVFFLGQRKPKKEEKKKAGKPAEPAEGEAPSSRSLL